MWRAVVTAATRRQFCQPWCPHLPAGVHSRYNQLKQFIDGSVEQGAKRIRVHILTDGRDVPVSTAKPETQHTGVTGAAQGNRHALHACPGAHACVRTLRVAACANASAPSCVRSCRNAWTCVMRCACLVQHMQGQEPAGGGPLSLTK